MVLVAERLEGGPVSSRVSTFPDVFSVAKGGPFSSPTLSFIPDLKPSFPANPSHCSLSFSPSGLTT